MSSLLFRDIVHCDERINFAIELIQHIKIWRKHQFLAEIKFYESNWFNGQRYWY